MPAIVVNRVVHRWSPFPPSLITCHITQST